MADLPAWVAVLIIAVGIVLLQSPIIYACFVAPNRRLVAQVVALQTERDRKQKLINELTNEYESLLADHRSLRLTSARQQTRMVTAEAALAAHRPVYTCSKDDPRVLRRTIRELEDRLALYEGRERQPI